MDDLLRVTTATPDLDSAKRLARTSIDENLAGNAQITGPVVSVYRHLGETGEGEEYALVLSTTRAAYPALEAHLREHHPWENPEITATEYAITPESYAQWLTEATTRKD
jgi:periplasmic divalent cation tolerance protein